MLTKSVQLNKLCNQGFFSQVDKAIDSTAVKAGLQLGTPEFPLKFPGHLQYTIRKGRLSSQGLK